MKKKLIIGLFVLLLCAALVSVCVSLYATSDNKENGAETAVSGDASRFTDVAESDWFFNDVKYVCDKLLMNGTGEDKFSPNETATRGMIAVILWRLDGSPEIGDKTFSDTSSAEYYFNAVKWATAKDIVNGYDDEHFGPEDNITREQLATVLYRYAGYKNYDLSEKSDLNGYKDADKISDYALTSMQWANANKIITGTPENTLEPGGNALRCEIAAILRRFCEKYSTVKDSVNESVAKNDGNTVTSGNVYRSTGGDTSSTEQNEPESDAPEICVEGVSGTTGENVRVAVKIKNNPGVLGMILNIYYDEDAMTLESAENGEAFSGILDMTVSKELKSGARFIWDGIDIAMEDVKDGDILYLNFKISDTPRIGKYPISLVIRENDVVDSDLKAVKLSTHDGYIDIK